MEKNDLEILKSVKETLSEQVEKLQIQHSNIEAQIHQKKVFLEGQNRLDKAAILTEFHEKEQALKRLESNIEAKKRDVEKLEEGFQMRLVMLEKREQATLDLEKAKLGLFIERTNFNKYKYDTELELEKAKAIIAEAKFAMEAVDKEKLNFKAREKELSRKERYWNDVIGKLEEDKKAFEIYKENVLGQEVVNV